MSTSQNRGSATAQSAWRYALAALLCAFFSVIYEAFSHEVYSPWMVGPCVVPFALGTLPAALLARMRIHVGWLVSQLWACAVLTLTLGCCFAGVLEIYGTTSPWLPVFLAAGGLLALSTVLAMRLRRRKEYGRGQIALVMSMRMRWF